MGTKKQIQPWTRTYIGAESETILNDLHKQNWDLSYLLSRLQAPLSQLAITYHCNSHSNHGVQRESQEIHSHIKSFLKWMQNQKAWSTIWRQRNDSSFNLFVCLSLYFCRYEAFKKNSHSHTNEPSYSSKRSLFELPIPINTIKDGIMSAMTSSTQALPQKIRLPYQLHLEGLLNHEIAFLLDTNESNINKLIQEAKEHIKNPETWRNVS